MSRKHLLRKPHRNMSGNWWWYEENGGIAVAVEFNGGTRVVDISWRAIRAALKRMDRKP